MNLNVPTPRDEYNHLQTENNILKAENSQLKTAIINIKGENEKLHSELAIFKHLYSEACNNYVCKDLKDKLVQKKSIPLALSFTSHKENLGEKTISKLMKIKGRQKERFHIYINVHENHF